MLMSLQSISGKKIYIYLIHWAFAFLKTLRELRVCFKTISEIESFNSHIKYKKNQLDISLLQLKNSSKFMQRNCQKQLISLAQLPEKLKFGNICDGNLRMYSFQFLNLYKNWTGLRNGTLPIFTAKNLGLTWERSKRVSRKTTFRAAVSQSKLYTLIYAPWCVCWVRQTRAPRFH